MNDLLKMLRENSYPGRGIVIGKAAPDCIRVLYFIMGRSVNSRNRVFTYTEDGIRTQAYDESQLTDPSLIIYHPVRFIDGRLIVTNGDQTDTVRDFLAEGKSFRQALETREFEPDAPNFTPRISGIVDPDGSFELSILKSRDNGAACVREYWRYNDTAGKTAYFISTYLHDGNPLPSFDTAPVETALPEADELWRALDSDNKVSLYCCDYNIRTGRKIQRLYNKHLGD